MMDPKPDKPEPKSSKDDWATRLGKQSSGVPQPETRRSESTAEADRKEANRLWRLAGTGLQMAVTTGLFWFMGYEMDSYMGWNGGGAIGMTSLAIVGSLYLVVKEAIKANK